MMWPVRAITEDEAPLFRARLNRGFGADIPEDEQDSDRFLELFEIDRTFAAFDGEDIIGTGGAFSFQLTVPGAATVGMGGTTIITTQPTHRRRGVLRSMMDYHLDEVAGQDEPLAGLWASESAIYSRFGFGIATERIEMKMDAPMISFREHRGLGSVKLLEAEAAEPVMRELYEAVRLSRPGMLSRSDTIWRHSVMWDPSHRRRSRSARRYAVAYDGEDPVGYATYRQKEKWEDFPEGEISVIEIIATTDEAHEALWHYLTTIDLFPKVVWWNAPIDDPLPERVTYPRRVRRKVEDSLWLRILDVPAALEARRYEMDGTATFAVADEYRPDTAGTYRLEVSDGVAQCRRVAAEPEVEFDVDTLGSVYLGAPFLLSLAAAGRVRGAPEAVRRMHRMFRTDVAPWCEEVF